MENKKSPRLISTSIPSLYFSQIVSASMIKVLYSLSIISSDFYWNSDTLNLFKKYN